MFRKFLMFAITSGLAARAVKAIRERQGARAPRVGRTTPEALSVWEDEGGNPAARSKPIQHNPV